jgi:4'-phosphopantetheinyl transferase
LSTVGECSVRVAGAEVFTTRLDASPEGVRSSAALLSDDEQDRAGKFAFERERSRYIVARAALRRLLGERLCVAPSEVVFAYGAHGKPRLGGPFAESALRFNLSHAEQVAVFAFALGREVGIDVEPVREFAGLEDVARVVFSREEYAAFRALKGRARLHRFFNVWTRKEALMKALGTGFALPLDRIDVSRAPGMPARILHASGAHDTLDGWAVHDFLPGHGMAGAVVVRRAPILADVAA